MYLVKTPVFVQNLFPGFIWRMPSREKCIFLTFDDGPIPKVTPWVLDLLNQYDAKATFFCVGENVKKYPEIYSRILQEGHVPGNHTYNHFNGWASANLPYYQNVERCSNLVKSDLFRPPYGKLKPGQAAALSKNYKIVMWDVLSGDFDPKIGPSRCFRNVTENAKPGSVIVFHDSVKAWNNLELVLPKVLKHYSDKGYSFRALEPASHLQSIAAVNKSA